MAMKSPSDVAKKWSKNLSASTESIRQGVQATTSNPAEKAIAAQDRYVAGVQRAVSNGDYRRGLQKVTLQSWQEAMITKGLPRVASGATAAVPKMQQFMESWLPYQEQLKTKLQSLPRGDLQQNIQRMLAAVDHNANFKMK